MQIECSLVNRGNQNIPDVKLNFSPNAGIAQIWNMTSVIEGKVYSLPDWSVRYGGLKPNDPLSWGGIVSNPNVQLKYTPARLSHTEL